MQTNYKEVSGKLSNKMHELLVFIWDVFIMDVPPNNDFLGNENNDAKAPPFCFPNTGNLMAFLLDEKELAFSLVIVPFSKQVIWVKPTK